jgi:hypothetical protein
VSEFSFFLVGVTSPLSLQSTVHDLDHERSSFGFNLTPILLKVFVLIIHKGMARSEFFSATVSTCGRRVNGLKRVWRVYTLV